MLKRYVALFLVTAFVGAASAAAQDAKHNVVLFVPDGLRRELVTHETAPTFAEIRDKGVNFVNSHSLFPTFTMPNSSGMATGHYLGDTGVFGNVLYAGFPIQTAASQRLAFIENDGILGDIDNHFAGNFIDEETILHVAHRSGFNTAAIGKIGPTLVFDHTSRGGGESVIIDDATGTPAGIPLAPWVSEGLVREGLPAEAPGRLTNKDHGDFKTPGTRDANVVQQGYFASVLTDVVLPKFKADGKPFVVVFWSRDPDGSQHNQGDSFLRLEPGINGPTSMAAIRNADSNLASIRRTLQKLGLAETTNIIVSSDHGFSTISKQSQTSEAAKQSYPTVPALLLPPGFLAIDLAAALDMPLYDPDNGNAKVERGQYPTDANGYIGEDANAPKVVVAANGGSDLVYIPSGDRALAQRTIDSLLAQDYVSGIFVDDDLGSFAGTLPLSAINLKGAAQMLRPSIVVNFKSFSTGCSIPTTCAVEVADTGLQQGQGMHGSFNRGDTANFMAAFGPDFKQSFVDEAPASNADIGKTIAAILGLLPTSHGKLVGRPLAEAFPNGAMPKWERKTLTSQPSASGLRTILNYQISGETKYFDAAGFEGRTVGLHADAPLTGE
ncbi:nucleotide pyrophosphatase/phosphodiesterase family protein [Hyphomicrobium sp.]|uniref:nucleotide pyrophosphatase/phosphodiesterase family protein n=1 Tax=Hyphomicrobium sp. TaxID=82 RepID=UPI000FBB7F71|nr:nucleotide pyrophosphatase/phosphodiesterase family protein [Hyphomicrobium sp.]RUO97428.1 MAG: alkaline phosphatase family protein [Hyphomicrobium sp.]